MTFNPIQLSMEPEKIFLAVFGKDVSCMQGRNAIMEITLVQIEQKIGSINGGNMQTLQNQHCEQIQDMKVSLLSLKFKATQNFLMPPCLFRLFQNIFEKLTSMMFLVYCQAPWVTG